MTTALERLEKLLNEKEEELQEVKDKLAGYEAVEKLIWMYHSEVDKDEKPEGLPVPRLELRWSTTDEWRYNAVAVYSLVYKHLLGHLMRVPLGVTTIRGASSMNIRALQRKGDSLPFRDGCHIQNEAKQLSLPAFVICEDQVVRLEDLK